MRDVSADATLEPTLPCVLATRASKNPDRPCYTRWLEDAPGPTFTYAEMERRARRIAAELLEHVKPGDRAVLIYPPGLDYAAGFFGCLWAGVIAVPAYPPEPSRLQRMLPRLLAIVRDCDASIVLGTSEVVAMAGMLGSVSPELAAKRWLATDNLSDERASTDPWARPSDIAFLQYTSGSTGQPRGVEVTHRALMSNLAQATRHFAFTNESKMVSWLPPYHDMGLIGGLLIMVYVGGAATLLAPFEFLRKPISWLRAIHEVGANVTAGSPNFGYELCVRKTTPEQRAELDLSGWRLAFNGAEPIRREVVDRFADAFRVSGFRPEAMFPCYGLAEATLMVSGGPPLSGTRSLRVARDALARGRIEVVSPPASEPSNAIAEIVACGVVPHDVTLRIVDPETRTRMPTDAIGEIWVRGSNVAAGYWNRPADTLATFEAQTAEGERPFLRTGDLGFVAGEQLYVVGRVKDLIIIRGQNVYPQDIETLVEESHVAIRRGCTAAFSIDDDGNESVCVVLEIDRRALAGGRSPGEPDAERRQKEAAPALAVPNAPLDVDIVARAVRAAVVDGLGVFPQTVVFLPPGEARKTSSGKIQRAATKKALLGGELTIIHRSDDEVFAALPPLTRGDAERADDASPDVARHRKSASSLCSLPSPDDRSSIGRCACPSSASTRCTRSS